jgi:hypothetical protein
MAKEWLPHVPERQRSVREGRVEAMARALREGRFMSCTGSTIVFDREGRCIDGQHRLQAIARSGVATTSFVVTGVSPEAIHYLDHGVAARSAADDLKIRGEKNCHRLAGAARLVWLYENNRLLSNCVVTTDQIGEVIRRNPTLRDSIGRGERVHHVLAGSIGTFLHFIFGLLDAELADWFLESLAEGTGLFRTDSTAGLLLYRERLLGARAGKAASLCTNDKIALAFKAWNAKRLGQVIRSLKCSSKETFPEIV